MTHQSWLMGSAAALNRERKCEDFIWNHRKAQMKSRWRVGASENEWQNVTKNFTECLFRLFKEKGLQVKDLQCLRRNNDLLEQLGGKMQYYYHQAL